MGKKQAGRGGRRSDSAPADEPREGSLRVEAGRQKQKVQRRSRQDRIPRSSWLGILPLFSGECAVVECESRIGSPWSAVQSPESGWVRVRSTENSEVEMRENRETGDVIHHSPFTMS